ncbi:hypothetical protein GOP47_0025440 [Adiantum capillus-veneris]|uniref:Protein disulfide isomerase-like 1-4 n=1 Tax=Adiantum capillus-veneris TaxID=13818 RepID=A0A9D4U086_ADICA|nr:hypothetical protein GOP47_0025440 [Adiantum capillus-veneris]
MARFSFALCALLGICLLLCRSAQTSESSLPELDAAEIEALGIEDGIADEVSGGFDEEEFGEDDFPTGGEDDAEDDFISHIADPDVVVLSSGNFSEFLATNHYVMVEFYAPWCGHCQALAPEYATAATELKLLGVYLAKVDATVEAELAQQHGIQGYPTIIFFVDGKPKPYAHHRTSEAIVSWIKKKVGPAVAEVNNAGDVQGILESGNTLVVALFDKLEGNEVEEFISAARQEDDVLFYYTKDTEVAELLHIKPGSSTPSLVLLKSAAEKVVLYDGKFDRAAISEFVLANKLPLISYFSRDTATAIFESAIKKQIILFASPEDAKELLPAFEGAAKSHKGKIIFVFVDSTDEEVGKPIVEFFGVSVGKAMIVAFTVSEDQPTKFFLENEPTEEKIKEFATGFLDGKLKQFYKSDPLPEKDDGDVKVVVGNNFDEIVLDESKDVLLEIYAPWCGHCQALEPIYEKLGKVLRGIDSLVIAKMDGTTNEHPRGKSDGYPTLLFFPAGNKSFDPVTVDVDRTVKSFYQFLKKNAAIPFTIAKSSKGGEPLLNVKSPNPEPTESSLEVSHEAKDEL